MRLPKELSEYTSIAELQGDVDVVQRAGGNLLDDLTYYLAIQDRASELIEIGLESLLGGEKYSALVELRRMSLSYAELTVLSNEKLLIHRDADRPAEAPMGGRVHAHIFSFIYADAVLCTFEINMPSNYDLLAQANLRLGHTSGETGVVDPKELVPEIVSQLKGPTREDRLDRARQLFAIILTTE